MFKPATKRNARLRMAIVGPAGSGKTYTSLKIASALAGDGRIAVLDTEHGSASKYGSGKPFRFDVAELEDFNPRNYIDAIRQAEEAGYSALVIDSLSHAWTGRGGALELKDNAARASKSGNSYTAWRDVTPLHNALIDAILQSRLHIIATMRAKTEYIQDKDPATGKTVIRKVGLAPVQRDGMEYEFDIVGDLDESHTLIVTKTRCPEIADKAFRHPGAELAATIKVWLTDGAPEAPAKAPEAGTGDKPVIPPAPSERPAPPPETTVDASRLAALRTRAVKVWGFKTATKRILDIAAVPNLESLGPLEVQRVELELDRQETEKTKAQGA